MFNSKPSKIKSDKPSISKPRKQRSDKKHDIKIVVSKSDKQKVMYNSRLQGLSEKKYCTALVKQALNLNCDFDDREYPDSKLTVHINPDKELYTEIVNKSVDWQCSIRKAAHRIFTEALRLETGGIEIEGLQQKKPIAKIF